MSFLVFLISVSKAVNLGSQGIYFHSLLLGVILYHFLAESSIASEPFVFSKIMRNEYLAERG